MCTLLRPLGTIAILRTAPCVTQRVLHVLCFNIVWYLVVSLLGDCAASLFLYSKYVIRGMVVG